MRWETMRGHGVLLPILILGTALRFAGLGWGIDSLRDFEVEGRRLSIQEASFHPDADALTRATGSLRESIHPRITHAGKTYLYSVYGPVFMYLWWLAAKLAATVTGFSPFNLQDVRDADLTRLTGRFVSALAGVATLYATWRIGRRCYGPRAAALAALLLSITVLHIQSSHFATVDVAMGLFVVLAFYPLVGVAAGQDQGSGTRQSLSAGMCVGLAAATKLNAAIALVPMVVACLQGAATDRGMRNHPSPAIDRRTPGQPSPPGTRKGSGDSRGSRATGKGNDLHVWRLTFDVSRLRSTLLLSLAAAVGTFSLLVPSAVLRFSDYFLAPYFGGVTHSALLNVGEATMRGSYHFVGTPSYLYQIFDLFPFAMGVPLEAAVLLGCGWAVYRRRREDLLVLSFLLIYFIVVGRFETKYVRYFAVWMPFACLLAGRLMDDLLADGRRALRFAATAMAGVVVLHSTAYAVAFTGIYRAPDVRVEAARWLAERAGPGSVVVVERGHNTLRNLLPSKGRTFRALDIDALYRYATSAGLLADGFYTSALWDAYLRGADWLILSDDRLASRGRYPLATRYYDDLFGGGLGFSLVKTFERIPALGGIPFDDRASDVTCRQFDHPRVFVFRRTPEARAVRRDYRRLLRLEGWEKVCATLDLSSHANDALVFRACLSREVRASASDLDIYSAMEGMARRPDLLEGMRDPRYFVEEEDGWALNLKMTFE